MAQLTIYMEDQILKKIEMAAKREHKSLSKWIRAHVIFALEKKWPDHYFDLFGSFRDDSSLQRPRQPRLLDDVRKGRL